MLVWRLFFFNECFGLVLYIVDSFILSRKSGFDEVLDIDFMIFENQIWKNWTDYRVANLS